MLAWFQKAAYLPIVRNNPDIPSYPPLFFVRMTEKIRHFLLKMNRRFTHPNVVMWEMAHHMWLAAGISVVAELGIADTLRKGARPVSELADLSKTHEESLYRVMRMLASQGIFKELKDRRFASTPLAVPLRDDQIRYLILLHLNRNQFEVFGQLMHSVRSGETVKGDHSGRALFDHIGNDEKKNEWFNRAMTNASRMQLATILPVFPFRKYKNIIDLGGGEGLLLASVLSRAPQSRGILFDLPHALVNAGDLIGSHSLNGRLEPQGGDFFKEVPGGGDLYILKSVLHDWNDDSSKKILKNVHKAMNPQARLLVIEAVLDEGNKPAFGKMTDVLMMAAAGGRERTRSQWDTLLESSGFRIRKIHPTISPYCIIEALKIL